MTKRRLLNIVMLGIVIAFTAIASVYADGSTPYGGHTPTDTGIASADSVFIAGITSLFTGVSFLSVVSFIKDKLLLQ